MMTTKFVATRVDNSDPVAQFARELEEEVRFYFVEDPAPEFFTWVKGLNRDELERQIASAKDDIVRLRFHEGYKSVAEEDRHEIYALLVRERYHRLDAYPALDKTELKNNLKEVEKSITQLIEQPSTQADLDILSAKANIMKMSLHAKKHKEFKSRYGS